MTSFSLSWSPGPGTIKDVHHLFKTNQKAQGTGPGTYDSFWNAYIYGTRFSPELDDSPGPTTYNPKLPPNMPRHSMARRITDPYYDCNPAPPKYITYTRFHSRSSALAGEGLCAMYPKRDRKCEACMHYIRIDRQRDRRKTMNLKLAAQRMPPPKKKRKPAEDDDCYTATRTPRLPGSITMMVTLGLIFSLWRWTCFGCHNHL